MDKQIKRMWKAISDVKRIPKKSFAYYDIYFDEIKALNEIDDNFKKLGYSFNYGFIKGIRYQKAQEKKKGRAVK